MTETIPMSRFPTGKALAGIALPAMLLFIFSLPCRASQLTEAFAKDTRGQGMAAVALARQALEYSVRTHEPLPMPKDLPPLLRKRGAVFVSAMMDNGSPRCCMGTLTPQMPTLAEEIINNACLAAVADKRFKPLKPAELKSLRVIVSIIGDCTPLNDPSTLDPLRDGLAVRGPRETGVVLPGETKKTDTMLAWGRIRARLGADDPAECFRLEAIRYMEAPAKEENDAQKD